MNLGEELRRQRILTPDYQGVLSYLEKNPQLGDVLPSICAQARQVVFGWKAELILSVYHDPEIEDCHLSLTVRLPSYDENVTHLLDCVTEQFETELCDASGYLLVTTDFRIPKEDNGI